MGIRSIMPGWARVAVGCLLSAAGAGAGEARIEASHIVPENLVAVGGDASYDVTLSRLAPGTVAVELSVTDYFGNVRELPGATVDVSAKGTAQVTAKYVPEQPGYYDLLVRARDAAGTLLGERSFSFGAVPPGKPATAAEARAKGLRFGAKSWSIDDLWWRRPLTWNLSEAFDACALLGLPWTRHQFNQQNPKNVPGHLAADELFKKPALAVLKVEGFPESCYDAERYGPIAEFSKKHKRDSWAKWSVPKKEKYIPWLQGELAKLPPEAEFFEIGNEPWDKITAKEWAEYCQMIVEGIRAARPAAHVGTNIGFGKYARDVIRAGGLAGMDFITDHPYSFTPPPEQRTRAWQRNAHDFLVAELGRDLPVYVTEYGWPSIEPGRNQSGTTERNQARRTVRQSLMLYAEDVKALIPHWMADREYDPRDREHWFGLFRLEGRPKPVVMALAACARMIDGGVFVGDLPMGPGIGAMLFEKDGTRRLALWTLDEAEGTGRDATVEVDADEVTLVDLMGAERKVATPDRRLPLRLNADVVYLVGVGPGVADRVRPPAADLDPDQWLVRGAPPARVAKAGKRPVIDGKDDDWPAGGPSIKLLDTYNTGRGEKDLDVAWRLSWDADALYMFAKVGDNQVRGDGDKKDFIQFLLGLRPDRQMNLNSLRFHERWFRATPPGEKTAAAFVQWRDPHGEGLKVVKPEPVPAGGGAGMPDWKIVRTEGGWNLEAAIPWSQLEGVREPKSGGRLYYYADATDFDGDRSWRKAVAPFHASEGSRLPYLILE